MFRNKYCTHKNKINHSGMGRPVNPDLWLSGPDPITHEKYYAWLKHKSQAKFRKEEYELTFEDWQSIWSDADFVRRGRSKTDLCLSRTDVGAAWTLDNCNIVTREQHLKRNREFRKIKDE